jgi:hypothetical protein
MSRPMASYVYDSTAHILFHLFNPGTVPLGIVLVSTKPLLKILSFYHFLHSKV